MIYDDVQFRPRSTGEILDDAWRTYFVGLPLLLVLSGLFFVPAAAATIWLLTQPADQQPWYVAVLAAVLLVATGLGAGACQEAMHFWAERLPTSIWRCLKAVNRRALNHLVCQALLLALPMSALFFFVVPSLIEPLRWLAGVFLAFLSFMVMVVGVSRHAILAAGQKNLWRALRDSGRASGRQPLRAAVIVASRFLLLGFALLNLHMFFQFGLWIAEDMAGFNVAVLRRLCTFDDPAYLVLVVALAWWLLTPFFEAANFLFYVDSRSRFEALDLWLRVEEHFPSARPPLSQPLPPLSRGVGGAAAVAALLLLLFAGQVSAQTVQDIRNAQKKVADIRDEMRQAEPYPGGKHWDARLRRIRGELDQGKRVEQFRWFNERLDRLDKDRTADLQNVDGLVERLKLIEASFEPAEKSGRTLTKGQIKSLLPEVKFEEEPEAIEPKEEPRADPKERERKQARDDGFDGGFRGPAGPGVVAPVGLGQAGMMIAYVFLGVVAAVLLGALALAIAQWLRNRPSKKSQATARGDLPFDLHEGLPDLDKQDVRSLWHQADVLAQSGRYLEATRVLYLGVLALLHQAGMIRYERTRTNGEYADQLRRKPVHRPFLSLTRIFEVKWYGERSCQPEDYSSCRGLAETIRETVATPA